MKANQLANVVGAWALSIVSGMEKAIGASSQQSESDLLALLAIAQQPALSIDQLRHILQLSHSATSRVVDRLASSRFVLRESGPDGRTLSLMATDHGLQEAAAISERRLSGLRAALAPLSAEEKAQLAAISVKLMHGVASTRIDAQRVCCLCDHSVCFRTGHCPVAKGLTHASRRSQEGLKARL